MKEKKFKVWDKDTSTMYTQNELIITFDNIGEDVYVYKDNTVVPIYAYELLEYTGVTDKNGVEIYENDIIPYHFNENIKGVVKFGEYKNPCEDKFSRHQGFYVDFNGESKDYYRKDLGYWSRVSKVIGNVYENKEL